MSDTDKQFNAKLIEIYYSYMDIRDLAAKEGATETVELLNKKMKIIKLQLQPLELPED